MSVGTDSEILGGSEVGAGIQAPDYNGEGIQTSGAEPGGFNSRSGDASFGGETVTPADKAFQGTLAATESRTFTGSVTVAASIGARADAIGVAGGKLGQDLGTDEPLVAANDANFYTKGSAALADVAAAPYSPDKVIANAELDQAMPARGLPDGTPASRQQGGLAIQYEPFAATGNGKNNQAAQEILLGLLDPLGAQFSSPDIQAAAERGLAGATLANLAASLGLDLAQGAVNFGNSAAMASKAGATNFAQVSDQFYGGNRGLPNAAISGATTQQIATNIAAFAQVAGIELDPSYQQELESYGATPEIVAATAPIIGEAITQSLAQQGIDAFPGTTAGQFLGTGGATQVPQYATDFNLTGNLHLGMSPIGNIYEMGRIAGMDPYNQTQSPLGMVERGPDLSPPDDQQAPSGGFSFDASRFDDVPSSQPSIGFGTGFGGYQGGLDGFGNPTAGGFGGGAAFNDGIGAGGHATMSGTPEAYNPGYSNPVAIGPEGQPSGAYGGVGTFGQGLSFGQGWGDFATDGAGKATGGNSAAVSTDIRGREQGAFGGAPTFGQGLTIDHGLAAALGLSPDDVAGLTAGSLGLSPNDVGGISQARSDSPLNFDYGGTDGAGKGTGNAAPDITVTPSDGLSQSNAPAVSTDMRGQEQGAFGGAPTFGQGLDLSGGERSSSGYGLSPNDVSGIISPDITVTPADGLSGQSPSVSAGFGGIGAGQSMGGFSAGGAAFNTGDNALVSNGAPPGLDPGVWGSANQLVTNMGMGDFSSQPKPDITPSDGLSGQAAAARPSAPGDMFARDYSVDPLDNSQNVFDDTALSGGQPSVAQGTPQFDTSPGPQARPDFEGIAAQGAVFSPDVTGQGTFGSPNFNAGAVGFAGSPSGFSQFGQIDFSGGPQARPDFGIAAAGQQFADLPGYDFGQAMASEQQLGQLLGNFGDFSNPNSAGYSGAAFDPGSFQGDFGGGLDGLGNAPDGLVGNSTSSLFDFAPPDSVEQGGVPAGFPGLSAMGLSAEDLGISSNSPEGPSTATTGSVQGAIAAEGGVGNIAATSGGFPDPSGLAAAQESAAANQAAVASNPSTTANAQAVADAAHAANTGVPGVLGSVAADAAAAMGDEAGGGADGPGAASGTSSADGGNNGGPGSLSGGEGNSTGAGGGPGGQGSGASGTGDGGDAGGGSDGGDGGSY